MNTQGSNGGTSGTYGVFKGKESLLLSFLKAVVEVSPSASMHQASHTLESLQAFRMRAGNITPGSVAVLAILCVLEIRDQADKSLSIDINPESNTYFIVLIISMPS